MKPVVEQIRAEIARQGAISFARFMELALYCPHYGYYEQKEDTPGKRGDYYTSVSVGPLFGELLAFQFTDWLWASRVWGLESGVLSLESRVRSPESGVQRSAAAALTRAGAPQERGVGRLPGGLHLVEAGAQDGQLAKDILNWLKLHQPVLFERLEYWIVEPSARRQQWQRETLNEFGSKVRWLADLKALAPGTFCGVIFSNELLDAMPVHRLGWDAKRREWFEWGVTIQGERFDWCRLPASGPAPRATHRAPLASELLEVLPDGFTTEVCPAAENWWRAAAGSLKRGRLLTLDYGLNADEFFAPQRMNGTLRAYHRHHLSADLLAKPGEQDLTAHVNFTAIQQAGEVAGLKTESFQTQAQFLIGIGQRAWSAEKAFGPWSRELGRQFQTLTHPQHLGRAFRVLVQSLRD